MSSLKVSLSPHDHALGPPDARLVLIEYGDFQCPFCATAYQNLKTIRAALPDDLLLVFRHFPLTEIHEYAFLGALSAEAAGIQGKFWEMHDRLFESQELLSPDGVEQLAVEIGLDLAEFRRELKLETLMSHIRQDFMGGVRSGVTGTPSLFLNGHTFAGPLDVELFEELVEAA
jgi:protein-disulfide isomerase